MRTFILPALLAAPLVSAFALETVSGTAAPFAEGEPHAVATSRTFERTLEFDGVFVPAEVEELAIWPEAYSGSLSILEAVAHGSYVSEGEVVVRLDTRSLEEQIEGAARAMRSAEIAHEGTVVRAKMAAATAEETRRSSEAELERSRRSLEGYLERELDFRRRSTESGLRAAKNNVQDQKDELEQLEAMYREDDLFAATEEIVLRRSRRDLHEAELRLELAVEQAAHARTLSQPMEIERRREQVAKQESAHRRLLATQELGALSREDGVKVSAAALEEKHRRLERLHHDLELLVVRAPRTGVFLHGGPREYGAGRTRPEHRRGGHLAARSTFASVVDPERLALAFSVSESQLAEVETGLAARVVPVISASADLVGVVSVERYPTPGSASAPENRYAARVAIDRVRPGILVGSRGKASIELERIPDAVVVPAGAVFGEGKEAHCWASLAEGAAFERVSVELGPAEKGEVVIEKGIEAGWRVLLAQPGS